jgi:hypothetical protein
MPAMTPPPVAVNPVPPKLVVASDVAVPPAQIPLPHPAQVSLHPLPAPAMTPSPVVVASLSPADTRTRLAQAVASLSCSHVTMAPGASAPRLAGFVASDRDRARLADAAGTGAADGLGDVVVRPWPQCEALLTFGNAVAAADGLTVQVTGAPAVVTEGDHVVVEVTTPSFPSYLYVTYLQASGDAVHLIQPRGLVPKPLPPHTKLTFGADEHHARFRVSSPFGPEMIVAIASASPLFNRARPGSEIERDYLTAFRMALLAKPASGAKPRMVAAATTTLTTRSR